MDRRTLPRLLRLGALAAVSAAALAGCVVAPVPYYSGEVVGVAPPAPQVEYYGAPPVVGQVWIGGYWNWVGNRHVWVNGHWDHGRPGHHWVPHHWQQVPGGWRPVPGHWSRR